MCSNDKANELSRGCQSPSISNIEHSLPPTGMELSNLHQYSRVQRITSVQSASFTKTIIHVITFHIYTFESLFMNTSHFFYVRTICFCSCNLFPVTILSLTTAYFFATVIDSSFSAFSIISLLPVASL